MNEPSDPPVPIDLIDVLRQLVTVNQQIAQSLAEFQRLYAAELLKRDVERSEYAAERQQWKEKQRQSEARYEEQMKERERIKLPRLPWQMQLFWGSLYLLLVLCILLLAWQLFAMVSGRGQ